MKVPELFKPEKDLERNIKKLLKEPQKFIDAPSDYREFEIIKADTYAKSIAELKKRGRKPFTFTENVEARIIDYELNGKDSGLFDTWLGSVTGIAYKANSTRFKIVLRSDKLENIPKAFKQSFIPIDYDAEKGIELDSKKGKYDQLLTRKEVKGHEFWLAVMNGDKKKLAKYVDLWFDKTGRKRGLGVYLRSNTDEDELRGLALSSDNCDSDAYGNFDLYDFARFVSGAQRK